MRIDFSHNTLIITLYDLENVYFVLNAIEEIERKLCKNLSVDEDYLEDFNELHIDVDDYYEYVALRRLVLDFCPIF